MTVIRRFVEWLSYHPTTEEIARALATEYLSEFSVLGLRFGRINNDDSITNLGQFGFPDSENVRGRNIPSEEWRSVNSPEVGRLRTLETVPSETFACLAMSRRLGLFGTR